MPLAGRAHVLRDGVGGRDISPVLRQHLGNARSVRGIVVVVEDAMVRHRRGRIVQTAPSSSCVHHVPVGVHIVRVDVEPVHRGSLPAAATWRCGRRARDGGCGAGAGNFIAMASHRCFTGGSGDVPCYRKKSAMT